MKHLLKIGLILLLVYYLGIHNGNLAIFHNDKPDHIFPYSAELLPDSAQDLLKQGIPFSSFEELSKLLQTYLS